MSQEHRKVLSQENDKTFLKSRFKFLNCHNGLRPGCLHLFISIPGAGKSTVARSIIKDTAKEGNVFVWLSEETCEDFILAALKDYPDEESAKKIQLFSEIEPDNKWVMEEEERFWAFLSDLVNTQKPVAIFIDNITTSSFYAEKTSREQLEIIKRLKSFARNTFIPIFIVAHTRDRVDEQMERMIEMTDIRGTKSIINLVEYMYIFQRFHINTTIYPTVRLKKYRKHQVTDTLYRLIYRRDLNSYSEDAELPFKEFKEAYNARNKL